MMDAYFVRADQYGLDIVLYCHIFSYFDQVSKEVSLVGEPPILIVFE